MSSRSISQKSDPRGERVQKRLAETGLASRREIDRLIQAGRVLIDGRVAVPGDRLIGSEEVRIDGKHVRLPQTLERRTDTPEVLLYHKPVGEITARRDPEGRKTVFESLPGPERGRWIVIGRLDINTSGLLLFTTDGDLANRLMHPRYEVEREYAVRIRGELREEQIVRLKAGIILDDGFGRFEIVRPGGSGQSNSWYEVRLREGRNREVRRLFEAVGVTVSRLIRVRYGPIVLGRLPRGAYRQLSVEEIGELMKVVGRESARSA